MSVAAALVILASACGTDVPAPSDGTSAYPTVATSVLPAPADQLATYLQEVRPILRRMKAAQLLWIPFEVQTKHLWVVAAKATGTMADRFDAIALNAATTAPPPSLRTAHAKLVRAFREWSALYSEVARNLRRRVDRNQWGLGWRPKYDKAEVGFEDWWFAVRVEARKLGIALPRDWRKLPRVISSATPSPVASGAPTPATSAPDPFVGKWSGTDNYGQGPFTMEIRKLGDGKYVQIGAGGQRNNLKLQDGVLIGKAYAGQTRDIEARLRIERVADGALKESITANAGGELGDVTTTIVLKRKTD